MAFSITSAYQTSSFTIKSLKDSKLSGISARDSSIFSVKVAKVSSPSFRKAASTPIAVASSETSQTNASAQAETQFASVSAATAVAPAPAQPINSFVSGLVGGGVVAAIALSFVKKPAVKKTPSPIQAPAPVPALKPVPRATEAAPAALEALSKYFPNAIQDEKFVHLCAEQLFKLGFSRDNCIAMVNTCRDEVCRPLVNIIDKEFGLSFNISGLGGLVNCGKTGLKAGMSHSPVFPCDVDGKPRERYVFFAFPHVSVGETGDVGSLLRRGRGKPSSACGALIAIKSTASDGTNIPSDPLDDEFILLKKKVLAQPILEKEGLSLVTVTKAALEVIASDLENLISKTVDPATSDYAVITGVQIHSGNQVPGEPFRIERTVDYVAAGTMYAVIRGEKYNIEAANGEIKVAKSLVTSK